MGLKSAGRQPSTQHLPGLDKDVEPFQSKDAKIRELEFISDKTFCHRVNDQLIGLCQCLEAGSQIGGFAEHGPFLGGVLPHEFAHDDMTLPHSDSCSYSKLWMGIILMKRLHRIQNRQSGMYRSFRIIFT